MATEKATENTNVAALLDRINEQEATIQDIKARLPYWADELEAYRYDADSKNFEYRISEMRRTAEQL